MKNYYYFLFISFVISIANISTAQYQIIATNSNTYHFGNYYLLNTVMTKRPKPLYINNDLGVIPMNIFDNDIYRITDSLIVTTSQNGKNKVIRRSHRDHYELSERIYSNKYAVSIDTLDGVDENLKNFIPFPQQMPSDSSICVYLTLGNGPVTDESAKFWTRFYEDVKLFEKDNKVHITGTYIKSVGFEGEGEKYYTLTGLSPEQKIRFLYLAENDWLNQTGSTLNGTKPVSKLFIPYTVDTKYLRKLN